MVAFAFLGLALGLGWGLFRVGLGSMQDWLGFL
jgi:hypothetical protein